MEKSGFFNSSGGDRKYNAVDFAAYFGDLVSNGIFYRNADNLRVVPSAGMAAAVLPGSGWINGYRYENTAALALQIPTANGIHPRIDRVVFRWDNAARNIHLAVVPGAPAAVPAAPALTQTADIFELSLAEVTVPQAATVITADLIRDTRLNTALCGIVGSLVSAVYE